MTGELRKFSNPNTGKDDWLFIPNEFPPQWEFPTELWPLLSDAKEALGTLNGIGQTLPNPELLLRPLQNREAITSSSIEGTYVTPEQLLLYELDPREPTSAEGQLADWREVSNYATALKQGCRMLEQLPVCGRLICEMHKTLMSGARGARKTPGEFRKIQVQIGSTGKYIPPAPAEIDRLMNNLERYVNQGSPSFDPLVLCYLVHYQFEAIHPFSDGNGRVGRALLALMIYKWMRHTMPWLYMSAFFERYKDEYTNKLFRISTNGEWGPWIEFCLNGTIQQARDAIRRCDRFKQLRSELHERVKNGTSRSHKLVESFFENPVVNIPTAMARFGVTYKTAQRDLERLVESNVLREIPDCHPRSFYVWEIMQVAYGDTDDSQASGADSDSTTPPPTITSGEPS